jgi:hypothetical protein
MKYHLRKQYGASFRANGSPVHFSPLGMDILKLGRIYRTAGYSRLALPAIHFRRN